MFAGLKVLGLDCLLCFFNATADKLRLDRNAFFHAQALEQSRDPLFGEDTHQVIFEQEIKTRSSGIALAAGASAQLVVNATGLVALGAENEQAARSGDFVVLRVSLRSVAGESFVPLIGRHDVFTAGVVPDGALRIVHGNLEFALCHAKRLGNSLLYALLLGHELGIATEENVGAATRHVGGNRDHAFALGLGDDFGFLLVIFGVENNVLDSLFL